MADYQFIKDAQSILDYAISWASWLDTGETLSTSVWTVPTGITKDSSTNTDTVATIWVSGGTKGLTYQLFNKITTSAGRTERRYITIQIEEQSA